MRVATVVHNTTNHWCQLSACSYCQYWSELAAVNALCIGRMQCIINLIRLIRTNMDSMSMHYTLNSANLDQYGQPLPAHLLCGMRSPPLGLQGSVVVTPATMQHVQAVPTIPPVMPPCSARPTWFQCTGRSEPAASCTSAEAEQRNFVKHRENAMCRKITAQFPLVQEEPEPMGQSKHPNWQSEGKGKPSVMQAGPQSSSMQTPTQSQPPNPAAQRPSWARQMPSWGRHMQPLQRQLSVRLICRRWPPCGRRWRACSRKAGRTCGLPVHFCSSMLSHLRAYLHAYSAASAAASAGTEAAVLLRLRPNRLLVQVLAPVSLSSMADHWLPQWP